MHFITSINILLIPIGLVRMAFLYNECFYQRYRWVGWSVRTRTQMLGQNEVTKRRE